VPGNITSTDNRISVEGPLTTTEMPRLIAAMHNVVSGRGYRDITLDFSGCKAAFQAPMLAIVARAQAYWAEGVDISLSLPLDGRLRGLFINTNWAHLIDVRDQPESEYRGFRHVPAIKFKDGPEQHGAVTRILRTLLAALSGFDRADLRAIEWSLNEITDNVINHAESQTGGFVQVTNYAGAAKRIEFAVSDTGIGIPASLRTTHPEWRSDTEALDKAIREGVTRDKQVGQGNGLYGTWRIAELSGGRFEVYSGNAWLVSSPQQGLHIRDQQIPFRGSLIIASIRYAQPIDLSDALSFSGKKHTPVDFVEMQYETDNEGNLEFNLTAESAGFGSRSAGEPIRRKLVNLSRLHPDKKIVVNFGEVPLISSSYADEVFGKMFATMGPVSFSQQIGFRNVDPLVEQLINRAIIQRMTAPLKD
jgi:anti-sigma regulatory factor (Ser/Thr protein kinase)